jgi:rhodanese-related sulfurtransferase
MLLYLLEGNMRDRKQMKQTILKGLLLGAALCGFLSSGLPAAGLAPFTDITPAQAAALIKEKSADPLFKIIDVRSAAEFAVNHIRDAQNIDVKALDFAAKIAKLDKDGIYLVYCKGGVRSARAMNLMKEAGFKQVFNLAGGLMKWQEEKLPPETAPLQTVTPQS